ncbi:MAG: glutathionylspermidine synthase family protein [Burkholderiaceae bacterium]
MERVLLSPRPDWQAGMEAIGFSYHSIDGVYWDESRAYRFTEAQIDELEAASAELHELALKAAEHVVRRGRWQEFAIPPEWAPVVEASWRAHQAGEVAGFSLYGRMDLSYDGAHPPKLLEYNADTPTAVLEASVAQWQWLQALRPRLEPQADQFNSIHEKLIEAWARLKSRAGASRLHFAAVAESEEDWGNLEYLRDTAIQAGWKTIALPIERIGFNGRDFVDEFNVPIEALFKLYPWEWLVREAFGAPLRTSPMQVIEPAWRMLLANKALLVVMWELFPGHPNLLPAFFEAAPLGDRYVKKPKLAREGANVEIVDGARREAAAGPYGAEGWVYQALAPLPRFGADHTVIGSWLIDGVPAGIGLREDASSITCNTSRFVPHYFV